MKRLSTLVIKAIRRLFFSLNGTNSHLNELITERIHFLLQGNVDIISEFGVVCDSANGPDTWFGEVGIIEGVPRTATVLAKSNCITYSMPGSDVIEMISKDSSFGKKIKDSSNKRMQAYLERNVLA
jgi:CRP-like cAMP-binding protein